MILKIQCASESLGELLGKNTDHWASFPEFQIPDAWNGDLGTSLKMAVNPGCALQSSEEIFKNTNAWPLYQRTLHWQPRLGIFFHSSHVILMSIHSEELVQ